ncbi:uncharacterized protein LOC117192026 isoform X3 [Drosophila miranda]|uniref:uncharacterized protein LOC117192026 isoform X3 n=1 Tax=Drosophila miranda TaxID=7229 RepID=UPI000011E2F8|nr:uncharacterized protein LOC117192026 isoform X3 [Drosophila miranda]AAB27171.1 larval cuticle protein 4, LCP4=Lcp4 gene product {Y allele} [Drosophila miranda, Peptide, 65 aa] [Drosophila miranda]
MFKILLVCALAALVAANENAECQGAGQCGESRWLQDSGVPERRLCLPGQRRCAFRNFGISLVAAA